MSLHGLLHRRHRGHTPISSGRRAPYLTLTTILRLIPMINGGGRPKTLHYPRRFMLERRVSQQADR